MRFEAASSLWRWYYWKVDDRGDRTGILEALATRLNTETDPVVRRGLHESIYDVLDENTGYMEAWIRTAGTQEDKDVISKGYEAVVRDQAVVLARVLGNSTALGREGILTALWDFHTRHMALPTLKEVIAHLCDAGASVDSLLRRAYLDGQRELPVRASIDPRHEPDLSASLAELLEGFGRVRRRTVDLLRGLSDEDWARLVVDPQQGELTLLDVCAQVTQHELAHLSQLRNLIALLPED